MSIQQKIEALAAGFNGRIGISALNLQNNETYAYHADEIFPTASVIKLGVLVTLMAQCEAGESSLDEPIMLRRADLIAGTGVLQYLTPGLTMPIRDYAFLMMNLSDNLATNVLIDYVGLKNIQTFLAESGFPDVHLHRKLVSGTPPQDNPQLGTAAPEGFTRLITAVFRRQIVSPSACDLIMHMMDGVGSDRVGRYLPFSLYGNYGTDEEEINKLNLAGKTGTISGVRAQTAVVWQGSWQEAKGFAITVMTADNPEPEMWNIDAAGTLIIGRIARTVYDGIFS
ncbi:MAG: serine hydrolase [Ardenticatenaceae bacterium]|nr:serine hydrolase [Ardenticatenaceae bacterium]